MDWTQVDADIPTSELTADTQYYVEKWGMGSWAAYHGADSIGEPGTYGTRGEAKTAAQDAYKAEGAAQHARWVYENYQAEWEAAGEPAEGQLYELTRRAGAALAEFNTAQRAEADAEHELEGRVS